MKLILILCTLLLAGSLLGCDTEPPVSDDDSHIQTGEVTSSELLSYGHFKVRWHESLARFEVFTEEFEKLGGYFTDLELSGGNLIAFPADTANFVVYDRTGAVVHTSQSFTARFGCYPEGALVIEDGALRVISPDGGVLADFGRPRGEFAQSDDNGSYRGSGLYGGPAGRYFEFSGKDGSLWYYLADDGTSGTSEDFIVFRDENQTISKTSHGYTLYTNFLPGSSDAHYRDFFRVPKHNAAGALEYHYLLIGDGKFFHYEGGKFAENPLPYKSVKAVGDYLLADDVLCYGPLVPLCEVGGEVVSVSPLKDGGRVIFRDGDTTYEIAYDAPTGFPKAYEMDDPTAWPQLDGNEFLYTLYDKNGHRVRTVQLLQTTRTKAGVFVVKTDAPAETRQENDKWTVLGHGRADWLLNHDGDKISLSVVGEIQLMPGLIIVKLDNNGAPHYDIYDDGMNLVTMDAIAISAQPNGRILARLDDGRAALIGADTGVVPLDFDGICLDVCREGAFMLTDGALTLRSPDGEEQMRIICQESPDNFMHGSSGLTTTFDEKGGRHDVWRFTFRDRGILDKEGSPRVAHYFFEPASGRTWRQESYEHLAE